MIFKLDGEEYPFSRLMYSEAVLAKKMLGMTVPQFEQASATGDPECFGFLFWLAKRRKLGMDCPPFADLDFDLAELETIPEPGEPGYVEPVEAE